MSFDQKILIIRFSSIGDIVLTTSPLKTIRNTFPKAQINYLTLEHFTPLLEFHPDIDRLIPLRKNMTAMNLWEFSDYIRKQNYSMIFDFHNSLRSNMITFRTTRPVLQLKKPRWNRFMLFQFHQNIFADDFSTRKMYHEHLGKIWQEGDKIPNTSLKVTNHEKNEALSFVGVDSYITLIPGAAWEQKQWSSDKYIELIQDINMSVVLLGEKKDKICFQIAHKVPSVINLAGKTSLRQAMAILSNSKHVIGSDTGLTHAAEALRIPVSMIQGPTSKETGASVHLENSRNIEMNLWCRPCSQNGKRPCYRNNQVCMDSISVADVIKSVPSI